MPKNATKGVKRYYGRVQGVRNENGSVRVDIRTLYGHGKLEENILMDRPHPGWMVVPKEGWVIAVEEDEDGKKRGVAVVSGPEYADSEAVEMGFQQTTTDTYEQFGISEMKPGEAVFQFDRNTALVIRQNPTDSTKKDMEFWCSGDFKLRVGGVYDKQTGVATQTTEKGITDDPA